MSGRRRRDAGTERSNAKKSTVLWSRLRISKINSTTQFVHCYHRTAQKVVHARLPDCVRTSKICSRPVLCGRDQLFGYKFFLKLTKRRRTLVRQCVPHGGKLIKRRLIDTIETTKWKPRGKK